MIELLTQLRLLTLAAQLSDLLDEARQQQLSYEAFLQRALTVERNGRQQRALERRCRAARLPLAARLETFDFSFQPSLSERLIHELASLSFLQTATNVLLLGPPGVGKTHLACSIALKALESGLPVLFTTLRELAGGLASRNDRPEVVLRRYTQPKLLIIDEVGYTRLNQEQAQALFELVTARYERSSIILTSNLSFAEWGTLLGDDVLATALLDRLLHHAEVISINGRSYRMRQRMAADQSRAA
jgi:DNA replication protein DnaC